MIESIIYLLAFVGFGVLFYSCLLILWAVFYIKKERDKRRKMKHFLKLVVSNDRRRNEDKRG